MSSDLSPVPTPGPSGADRQSAGTALAADLKIAVTLAELLQRVEASTQPIGALQYRRLVRHLAQLLDSLPPGPGLEAMLNAFPATAALYENGRYAQAGLCRSPLASSLDSELRARAALDKARGATRAV